jgi:hypothetical protein
MKNNREMLKEAIAEARTVKETAIANAKLALEETITPKLKSMLAKRLEEMEVEDELEEAEEMERKEMEGRMKSETEEVMFNEMEEAYDDDEEMNLEEILAELEKELEETNIDPGAESKSFLKKKPNYSQLEEEELTEGEEIEEEEGTEQDEEIEMDMEMDSEMGGDDEEIDLEEMSEEDLKSFIEDVIKDMVSAGELEAGDEFETEGEEAEGEEEIEVEDETEEIMEGDEEIIKEFDLGMTDAEFIASMLGSLALVGGVAVSAAKKELEAAAKKGKEAVASTMKKLLGASEIAEAEEMTNGVNLLNAKLLYLNKIFRTKNLTENQKAKIIPAFDKATTVKEVKLIFETISENFSYSKKQFNESRSLASKPVGVAPKKELIVEVDSQIARWQKLAGIK